VSLVFEWDPAKGRANARKHCVDFTEAATVFADPLSIAYPDPDHSSNEERYIIFGVSSKGRFLIVAHTLRENRIRIITAREMTRAERRYYEESR